MGFRIPARIIACALAAILAFAQSAPSAAADGKAISLLRDSEIEHDIHVMMTPVWKAAGLSPDDVHVYLVADDSINSFVAAGQNIFINSGLLLAAQTANQLIGVLAHETGHIAEGHLTRAAGAMHNALIEGLIATAVGAAASAFGGREGGAAMLPGMSVAERAFAHYSVGVEASADQAALRYLDRTHQSARGLLQFFQKLQSQDLLTGDYQNPYLRTHPLTEERIDTVREHVAHSPYSSAPEPPEYVKMMRRMKAKLFAFTKPLSATLAQYPPSDHSISARYARAIAYYRVPELDKALAIIDGLIRERPKNPYFRELKGQMLFENGHVHAAIAPYEAAVRLAPDAPLLRIELAQVDIESNEPKLNTRAIALLKDALRSEEHDGQAWYLLATAYGRDHQIGLAALSLAEQALAARRRKDALQEVARAQHFLPKNSPGYLRAAEIRREAEDIDSSD